MADRRGTFPELRPAWLRAMENGSIAEARTRSFLIDRFWVLERSVDMEGADLVIQRRLTGRSLFDRNPPRLGRVQAKFFASEETTQHVHREYVLDSDGTARDDFFLMCHTGYGSRARSYLAHAEDIPEVFRLAEEGSAEAGQFVIPGRAILNATRFEVVKPELSLDRIERALERADFDRNRRFMSWALPGLQLTARDIEPAYQEPIDNDWGDIPDALHRLRKDAENAWWALEGPASVLEEIVACTDPEKALELAEWIDSEYGGSVSLPGRLFDQDFSSTVQRHKQMHQALRTVGLLDRFLALRMSLVAFLESDPCRARASGAVDAVYAVRVRYDSADLSSPSLGSRTASLQDAWAAKRPHDLWLHGEPISPVVLLAMPGDVEICVGRLTYPERLVSSVLDEVYRLRFGDEA